MELQVEESASLQEIMDSVARTCGVSNDFIRIILDGKRARALQEVCHAVWRAMNSLKALSQGSQRAEFTLHCRPSSV